MALEAVDQLFLRSDEELLWELFHENSKVSAFEPHVLHKRWLSDAEVVLGMNALRRVKRYRDLPKVDLPTAMPKSRRSLDEVIRERRTARAFGPGTVSLAQLAKVLWMSYGISRDNEGTTFPRPFRMVPSGGALYPLEIYLHAQRVQDLEPGLYHYDPEAHDLDVLRPGDASPEIAELVIQGPLALEAAVTVFITAVFDRSVFKYGDRGYRFVLLEAGHLSQNANLVAAEMGLGTTNIGGYNDRAVDRYLGLDGLHESTVYALHLGPAAEPET